MQGKLQRFRSVPNLVDEVEMLYHDYGVCFFVFNDGQWFPAGRARLARVACHVATCFSFRLASEGDIYDAGLVNERASALAGCVNALCLQARDELADLDAGDQATSRRACPSSRDTGFVPVAGPA